MDSNRVEQINELKKQETKRAGRLARLWSIILIIVILSTLSTATYAWFSNNSKVGTNYASAQTNTSNITLQLSADGKNFSEKCNIAQVNSQDAGDLMPVSTSDLKNWVYSPMTEMENNQWVANKFLKTENESYYYHGRIYLRAEATGVDSGTKVDIYLDGREDAGGSLTSIVNNIDYKDEVLNASRLGLTVDGANPLIFYLSDTSNKAANQSMNTELNGVKLTDGQVISSSGNTMTAVADPAVNMDDYMVSESNSTTVLPDNSLLTIELNKTYTIDIYFYLEGCDKDCTRAVSMDETNLHVAFLGVLAQ